MQLHPPGALASLSQPPLLWESKAADWQRAATRLYLKASSFRCDKAPKKSLLASAQLGLLATLVVPAPRWRGRVPQSSSPLLLLPALVRAIQNMPAEGAKRFSTASEGFRETFGSCRVFQRAAVLT